MRDEQAERNVFERLDDVIERGHRPVDVIDADIAMLAAVATELQGMPDPAFKKRLRRNLVPGTDTNVPAHYVMPYLVVRGVPRLIDFIEQAFGGELKMKVPRADGSIQHAEMRIAESRLEMGDAVEEYPARGSAIHLYVENADAAYAHAIEAGAKSLYPPVDQPYGDREAGVVDPLGNNWFIGTNRATGSRREGYPTVTPSLRAEEPGAMMDFFIRALGAEEIDRTLGSTGEVVYGALRFGESVVEAGAAQGNWPSIAGTLHLFVTDCDAAYARAIDGGATSLYPPSDQSYGERSAGVTDPFGNRWFLATTI
jgi:PhnB protein